MATLQEYVDQLPVELKYKYSSDQWVGWANEWLRRLDREKVLPALVKEVGVEVYNDRWITKPADYVAPRELYSPANREAKYAIEEAGGKLTLADTSLVFTRDEDPDLTATVFAGYTVNGLTATMDVDEDELANHLMVVDGGTSDGLTVIIASNTETAGGTTDIVFLHALSSALSDTKITSCYFVDDIQYLVLRYQARFDSLSDITDTIPVDVENSDSLKSFLWWKAYARVLPFSQQTKEMETQFENDLRRDRRSILGGNRSRRAVPRYMAGLRQPTSNRFTPSTRLWDDAS